MKFMSNCDKKNNKKRKIKCNSNSIPNKLYNVLLYCALISIPISNFEVFLKNEYMIQRNRAIP